MDKETLESFDKVRKACAELHVATMELKETTMKIVENLHDMEQELIALQKVEARDGNFKN